MPTTLNPSVLEAIADATERAFAIAERTLPDDVIDTLNQAVAKETNDIARAELHNILLNIAEAERLQVPLCQDTGVPVVYMTIPPEIPFSHLIYEAVALGVQRATCSVPLRPNVVDPVSRHNSGNNCGEGMPAIHLRPGERMTVTVLPKGAGSENVSRIAMLLPSQVDEIERFVVETMLIAGGKPCPPVILGVGIGGTYDGAASMAKEALLSPVNTMDEYELRLCNAVNRLGIGPMGLGGACTALAVKVGRGGCHTASLPVAVNVQCWACRRATVVVELP
jgi:fumarate hydratase subunit alpha